HSCLRTRLHHQRDVLRRLRRSEYPHHLVARSPYRGIHPAQPGGHAVTPHLLIGVVVVELQLLAAAVVLAVLRERERRRPGVQLDIVPPEGKNANPPDWSQFYRKVFGVSYSRAN